MALVVVKGLGLYSVEVALHLQKFGVMIPDHVPGRDICAETPAAPQLVSRPVEAFEYVCAYSQHPPPPRTQYMYVTPNLQYAYKLNCYSFWGALLPEKQTESGNESLKAHQLNLSSG